MFRGVKSLLAVGALAAVGLALRWVTAGTITAANPDDLDSLTVLAVGGVAWIAYAWLVLAVLATALEQLPGAIGTAAGLVARGITSKTSRTLLRSALGVAAVTPLTVGMAQAATPAATHSAAWQPTNPHLTGGPMSQLSSNSQATAPRSSMETAADRRATPTSSSPANRSNYRATEPRPSLEIDANRANSRAAAGGSSAQATPYRSTYRATEPASSLELNAGASSQSAAAGSSTQVDSHSGTRATQRGSESVGRPASGVEVRADRVDFRATEPRSSVQPGATGEHTRADASQPRQADGSRAASPRSSTQDATQPEQVTSPRISSPRASARLAPNHTNFRATEPRSSVQPGAARAEYGVDVARPEQAAARRVASPRASARLAPRHTNFRATEPRSSVQPGITGKHSDANVAQAHEADGPRATNPRSSTQDATRANFRATEPASSLEIVAHAANSRAAAAGSSAQTASTRSGTHATQPSGDRVEQPAAGVERLAGRTDFRATEPRSSVQPGASGERSAADTARDGQVVGPRNGVRAGAGVPTMRPREVAAATARPQGPAASDGGSHGPAASNERSHGPTALNAGSHAPGASDGRSQDRSEPEGRTARPQGPAASEERSHDRSNSESRPRGVTGAPQQAASSAREHGPGVDGGRVKVPDRPEVGAATRYTDLRSRVTVAEGDSLWGLARRELGAQVTNEQIGARWLEWYAANRQVIGTDPNLILPGQVLRVPSTSKEQ